MKKVFTLLSVFCFVHCTNTISAQVWPYQIPPKWMFGLRAGFDFGISPYTSSPPNVLSGNPSNIPGMEASTAACDPTSALIFYSDGFRYYDYPANSTNTFPGAITPGSGSATDGAVAVPDPSDPANKYYLFTANDRTGGPSPQGINYYRFTKSGASVTVTGPTNLTAGNAVDESLCAGSDGNGGYWIVSHNYNNADYMIWHVTSGGVTASSQTPATVSGNSPVNGIGTNTATFKFNRCQDKIAYGTASHVQVYEWNRTTGTLGTLLYHKSGLGSGIYGLEFSPNGRFVYFTELAGGLWQIDLNNVAGSPVNLATTSSNASCSEMGTLQLGPDGKIYVTTCANAITTNAVYVGVINAPDLLACNYSGTGFTLKPSNAATLPSISRGIANMGWMSPEAPQIILTPGAFCSELIHTIEFETYFNTDIDVKISPASAIQWSFDNGSTWSSGDGTTSIPHDYGTGIISTTARVRFRDRTCDNYDWTASVPVSLNCVVAPVELLNFTAEKSGTHVMLEWNTATETDNDYFEIQHSTDGIHFTTIGTVDGHGNSNTILNYSFLHAHPAPGINYYRLQQHDFDGSTHPGPIATANMDDLQIALFPNPSSDEFHLQINHGSSVKFSITDVLGKTLYESSSILESIDFTFGQNFSSGTYFVQVVSGNEVRLLKVEKQ